MFTLWKNCHFNQNEFVAICDRNVLEDLLIEPNKRNKHTQLSCFEQRQQAANAP
jgi:hypothetical protein